MTATPTPAISNPPIVINQYLRRSAQSNPGLRSANPATGFQFGETFLSNLDFGVGVIAGQFR